MTLKEITDRNGGAFEYMSTMDGYNEMLPNFPTGESDGCMLMLYGERPLISQITDETYKTTLGYIWGVNKDRWKRIWGAWQLDYDVLANTLESVVTTSNTGGNVNETRTDDIDKTAYSSSDLITDSHTVTEGKTVSDTSSETTTVRTGSGGNVSADMVLKEIRARKNNIILDMIQDVADYIILSIY